MNSYRPIIDLAGEVCFKPTFWQIKTRINYLITEYLNQQKICDRLKDLPQQFTNPQTRDWAPIDLYHHGLHRIATEYSAVSLYIWLSNNSLKGLNHLATTMNRMTGVLHWDSWAMMHKIDLIYSFSFVLRQMWGLE